MGQPAEINVERALELMEQALEILDNSAVPGDVGAHLDLSIARLREHLRIPNSPQSISV
jgi:hypothetical protein